MSDLKNLKKLLTVFEHDILPKLTDGKNDMAEIVITISASMLDDPIISEILDIEQGTPRHGKFLGLEIKEQPDVSLKDYR